MVGVTFGDVGGWFGDGNGGSMCKPLDSVLGDGWSMRSGIRKNQVTSSLRLRKN